jgi:meiosis-specific transcription factor NDT80
MFYSTVPPRSYGVVPNSLAVSAPVLSSAGREGYTNPTQQGLSRTIDYRNPLDITKPFHPVRSAYSPHSAMSYQQVSPIYSTPSSNYPQEYRPESSEPPLPFQEQDMLIDIISQDNLLCRPEISCKVEKGFFWSQELSWTCYRRNYFSVSCSYSLDPPAEGVAIYTKERNERDIIETKQIQALAVCLSASVDGSNGKSVELVQHTPKRDKGPQLKVSHTKLCPTQKGPSHTSSGALGSYQPTNYGYPGSTGPILPLQHLTAPVKETVEGIQFPAPTATSHTFERIQFKNATANNGKRRAQQQYYHLIVELHADVRKDHNHPEKWVKIAQRVSQQVVVRGRSPSHYANEGPTGRTAASGLPGRTNAWSPFSQHSNALYASSTNGRMLSGPGNYIYSPMPSINETSSPINHHIMNGSNIPALESSRTLATNLSNGRSLFSNHTGAGAVDEGHPSYSYYPQPLYEAGLSSPNGPILKGDDMTHSGKSSSSPETPAGTFSGKYHGYESSKGYYPS